MGGRHLSQIAFKNGQIFGQTELTFEPYEKGFFRWHTVDGSLENGYWKLVLDYREEFSRPYLTSIQNLPDDNEFDFIALYMDKPMHDKNNEESGRDEAHTLGVRLIKIDDMDTKNAKMTNKSYPLRWQRSNGPEKTQQEPYYGFNLVSDQRQNYYLIEKITTIKRPEPGDTDIKFEGKVNIYYSGTLFKIATDVKKFDFVEFEDVNNQEYIKSINVEFRPNSNNAPDDSVYVLPSGNLVATNCCNGKYN